jgi:hypothetical protein
VLGVNGSPYAQQYGAWQEPATMCQADFNQDSFVNTQDFFDFLAVFISYLPTADFNHDTFINSQDFFDFMTAFFSGC